MAEYLIVADAVVPVASGVTASAAAGLARALVAAKHQVTILSLGSPELVGQLPGMARRLRTIGASAGGEALDLPLFEGRAAHAQAHLYVIGVAPRDRGFTSAVMGSAAAALARDGLLKPSVVLGWDEGSASTLSSLAAPVRLFALPSGRPSAELTASERAALGKDDTLAAGSLVALGVVGAHALLVPSPSCIRSLERHPALAARASDQPIVPLRFGADEPPFDPASDPTLPATYSPDDLAGKAECRRVLARRCGLALGPRTLVVATGPLAATPQGRAVADALPRVARLDAVTVVAAGGDAALTERAKVLAIEHPGKVVVVDQPNLEADRSLLAGADALLLTDPDDLIGRNAGIAQRYGTIPIAPDAGANGDYLVDYDPRSTTGSALLYASADAFDIEGAIRRAIGLRAHAEHWQSAVRALLAAAPRWATTVGLLETLELADARAAEPATTPPAG